MSTRGSIMHKKKVLVIGATSTVGRHVVDQLAAAGEVEAIAGVRTPSKAKAFNDEGISTVELDLYSVESVRNSLKGIDRIFLLTGYTVDMLIRVSLLSIKLRLWKLSTLSTWVLGHRTILISVTLHGINLSRLISSLVSSAGPIWHPVCSCKICLEGAPFGAPFLARVKKPRALFMRLLVKADLAGSPQKTLLRWQSQPCINLQSTTVKNITSPLKSSRYAK